MKSFYNVLTKIRESLEEDAFVNTVTYGDIFDVDLKKQSIFPISHFIVNNGSYNGNTWTFSISLLCMDIVDYSKEDTVDEFVGNDNLHDVLNTQLAVINRLLERLRRGDLMNDLYQINGTPSVEPFQEKADNLLAGWTLSFDIDVVNEMTIC